METCVGAHLANKGILEGVKVYYWREGNNEVDFVLRKGNAVTAIEVKGGQKRLGAQGLSAFKKRYPRAKTLVVGAGGMELKEFLETSIIKLVS
jgi:predicted AAA+ superfamily ATPase